MKKILVKEVETGWPCTRVVADSRSAISATLAAGNLCGPFVLTYTRKDALREGRQFDITEYAKQFKLDMPVFVSRAVWVTSIKVARGVPFVTDAICAADLIFGFLRITGGVLFAFEGVKKFEAKVRNTGEVYLTRFEVTCGLLDLDDPRPALTIQLGEGYVMR